VGGFVQLTVLLNVEAIWLPRRYDIRKLAAYEA